MPSSDFWKGQNTLVIQVLSKTASQLRDIQTSYSRLMSKVRACQIADRMKDRLCGPAAELLAKSQPYFHFVVLWEAV